MSNSGSIGWLLQRVSGALLFVLLVTHFVLMHFLGPEKRLYADVARRFANPLWKTFDLAFLALALSHGWYGVWGVVQDYVRNGAVRILALVLIVTAALALFSIGIVTILSFQAV
jgi:succinate dehydrogenase / fumarate reductase membrane anchor subunit